MTGSHTHSTMETDWEVRGTDWWKDQLTVNTKQQNRDDTYEGDSSHDPLEKFRESK